MSLIPETYLLKRLTDESTARQKALQSLSDNVSAAQASINDSITRLRSSTAAVKQTVASLSQQLDQVSSSLLTTQQASAEQNAAFAEQVSSISTSLDSLNGAVATIQASISDVQNAQATTSFAAAQLQQQLVVQFNNAVAQIANEASVRAAADNVLATDISTLSASVGTGAQTYLQSTAPTSPNVGDLWIDTGNGDALKRWNGLTWVDTTIASGYIAGQISSLSSVYATPGYVNAQVSNSITAAVASGGAVNSYVSGQISALSSVYATPAQVSTSISSSLTAALASGGSINSYVSGQISSLSSVYATPSQVTTTVNSTLTAALGSGGSINSAISSSVSSEASARASADSALSTSISTVSATANLKNSTFSQSTAPTANAPGDIWINTSTGVTKYWSGSAWIDTQIASSAISAAVSSEASARASADSALSTSISTVSATANLKNSTFSQSTTPTANATGDVWINTSTGVTKYWSGSAWVDTQIASSAITAAVSSEASARATADGYLSGQYALQVTAGNVVTGMVITSSSGPGSTVSDVIFNAGNFKIYNGSSGVAPFTVSSGVVTIGSELDVGSVGFRTQIQASGITLASGLGVFFGNSTALTFRVGPTLGGNFYGMEIPALSGYASGGINFYNNGVIAGKIAYDGSAMLGTIKFTTSGAGAPSSHSTSYTGITSYYGAAPSPYLGQPNGWLSAQDSSGNPIKIPYYT
jgi:prefoldin subunit 5